MGRNGGDDRMKDWMLETCPECGHKFPSKHIIVSDIRVFKCSNGHIQKTGYIYNINDKYCPKCGESIEQVWVGYNYELPEEYE